MSHNVYVITSQPGWDSQYIEQTTAGRSGLRIAAAGRDSFFSEMLRSSLGPILSPIQWVTAVPGKSGRV